MARENFDKEAFLSQISSFPYWVKTGDDLMKLVKHLQYRLTQNQALLDFYSKKVKLEEDEYDESMKISILFDDAYNNDTSKLIPFSKAFE